MSQNRPRTSTLVLTIAYLALGYHPAQAADITEIVQRAAAALTSDWAADPDYACIQRDEIQKGDKRTSKTFEVVMIEGSDYRLPLAVDDLPLPPEQQKTELIKLKHEVQRRAKESASARHARIENWKKRRDEDGELLLDFPTSLTFRLLSEETRNGHPAYLLAATPKPGLVPSTRAAKVLTGIEGTAWVERDTLHPMRVECTVMTAVPVFGALASVLPGTRIEINMTPVTDSVWLIDEVTMKLNVARLHMFKSSQMTRSTYSQYRPNAAVLEELLTRTE